MTAMAGWLLPQWPAPANVRSACTTRAGGRSMGPYDSLNLGDHVGDDALAVQANRGLVSDAISAHPVFLQQVHGTGVIELAARTPHATQADGAFTRQRGVACTMMVADCLPVLFAAGDGSVVGAAHAGWRGLAGQGEQGGQGILEATVHAMQTPAHTLLAWLGPCIGPGAFEVGDDVKAAFESRDPQAAAMFRPHTTPGKWLADLQGLARQRLAMIGVTQVFGNDGSDAWCTVGNPSRFFSHRRDRVSGRFAACVWLD